MHAIHFLLVVATTFSYLFEKLSSNHTVKMHILAYSICATQMPELSKMSRMIKLEQPVVQRMMALSRENQRTLQDEWNDATGQAGTKLMWMIHQQKWTEMGLWIASTAVTVHMTGDLEWMKNVHKVKSQQEMIQLGRNWMERETEIGDIIVTVCDWNGNEVRRVTLQKVAILGMREWQIVVILNF